MANKIWREKETDAQSHRLNVLVRILESEVIQTERNALEDSSVLYLSSSLFAIFGHFLLLCALSLVYLVNFRTSSILNALCIMSQSCFSSLSHLTNFSMDLQSAYEFRMLKLTFLKIFSFKLLYRLVDHTYNNRPFTMLSWFIWSL